MCVLKLGKFRNVPFFGCSKKNWTMGNGNTFVVIALYGGERMENMPNTLCFNIHHFLRVPFSLEYYIMHNLWVSVCVQDLQHVKCFCSILHVIISRNGSNWQAIIIRMIRKNL